MLPLSIAAVLVLGACGADPSPAVDPEVDSGGGKVLLAAGDITDCGYETDEATAQLVDEQPGTVLTLGDNAYEYGTAEQFAECYDPTWGRFKDRTRPSLGNHEYAEPGAEGHFDYFGSAAGDPGEGWYSFDQAGWHIVALNSNCDDVGCGAESPQGRWLESDLEANESACTLAYFHHPRFSSGEYGGNPEVGFFWRTLHRHGADVVLNGHEHDYERFAPLTPQGRVDRSGGIREFVVGTGGTDLREFGSTEPGSEVRDASTHGVLKLELGADDYQWEFLPIAGQTFTDAGTGDCH